MPEEIGAPTGFRTPVSAVRGRRPGPLDDGGVLGGKAGLIALHPARDQAAHSKSMPA